MSQPIAHPTSWWVNDFPDLKISAQEFYNEIETALKVRNIPDYKTSRINLNQGGLFSARREYLRVVNGEMTFDICSGPYGNGFFLSCWYGERLGPVKTLLYKIPYLGTLLVNLSELKTYFQFDTEEMFRRAVMSCISSAMTKVTSSSGIRLQNINYEMKSVEGLLK